MLLDEFEVASSQGNERIAMNRVAQTVEQYVCLPANLLENLKTAVAETTMNAMEHGNSFRSECPVKVQVFASDEDVIVRVFDQGGLSIPDVEPPDLDAKLAGMQLARGWGLMLIRTMVDDVTTVLQDGEHIVELRMKRPE